MNKPALFIISLVLWSACSSDNTSNDPAEQKDPVEKQVDDRGSWQDPYAVINLWNDQLRGKKIMEVGANDGYWTFNLIKAGADVTAADFSEASLEALMEEAERLGLQDQLKTRLITTEDPMLEPSEMDMV